MNTEPLSNADKPISTLKRVYRSVADRYPVLRTVVQATVVPAIEASRRVREFPLRERIARLADRLKLESAVRLPNVVGIGRRAEGRQIVMLVVSDLRFDPRVEREARALAAAGYEIVVLCPDPTQGADPDLRLDWGAGVTIEFLHWSAGSFAMDRPGFLASSIFVSALRYRPFAFHAHDLSMGYAGLAAARTTGAHLVADFHEWTSENVHWDKKTKQLAVFPARWKAELQALERRLLGEASAVVTVCDSIADALLQELGGKQRPAIVRNIPDLSTAATRTYPPLKQQLGLREDAFVLLYQGGTGPARLLEPIIRALEFAPQCTLVIRGPSLDQFGNGYRQIAEQAGATDRLILAPPVPSRDVVAAARGADAGIWSLPALCRNFTYALPNKIFEYISAGLPVLAAGHPEARRMVETNGIGITFDPYDPRSIATAINRMVEDTAFAQSCRARTKAVLAEIDSEGEWKKLVAIYNGLPRVAGRSD